MLNIKLKCYLLLIFMIFFGAASVAIANEKLALSVNSSSDFILYYCGKEQVNTEQHPNIEPVGCYSDSGWHNYCLIFNKSNYPFLYIYAKSLDLFEFKYYRVAAAQVNSATQCISVNSEGQWTENSKPTVTTKQFNLNYQNTQSPCNNYCINHCKSGCVE